ncbi:MAG: hypothetical protein RIQ56_617 [Candidatus Parcubacteria bacterium]
MSFSPGRLVRPGLMVSLRARLVRAALLDLLHRGSAGHALRAACVEVETSAAHARIAPAVANRFVATGALADAVVAFAEGRSVQRERSLGEKAKQRCRAETNPEVPRFHQLSFRQSYPTDLILA